MKEFIVGVDFGHGETAAFVVPLIRSPHVRDEGDSLSIHEGNKDDEKVQPSVVYYGKDSNYSLRDGDGKKLIAAFKGRISTLDDEKKRAFSSYIQCVFESIVRNNSGFLTKGTDGYNFFFCIACPTRWNVEERKEYVSFFNDALSKYGVQVLFVMNESDAAFFSNMNSVNGNELALVIDYGSSTIDYTLMQNSRKISDDDWSNQQLGANLIEKAILLDYKDKNFEEFGSTLEKTKSFLTSSGNGFVIDNIDERLEYGVRCSKEFAYSHNDNTVYLRYSFYRVCNCDDLKKVIFKVEVDDIDDTIKSYRENVKRDFIKLAEGIKRKTTLPLTKIILSGGASIMPWVKDYISEIFPDATIIKDQHPSYVVAKGVAMYAKARYVAENQLFDKIDCLDYENMYRNADAEATKEATVKMLPGVLKSIREGGDKSANDIYNILWRFFYGLDSDNVTYCRHLKTSMNSKVQTFVRDNVRNAIKSVFNLDVNVNDIIINLDYEFFAYPHTFYDPDAPGGNKILSILEDVTGPHVFTSFDPDKLRGADTRNAIANRCESEFSVLNPFGEIKYKEEDFAAFVSRLKPVIRKKLLDILQDKELFKTTFVGAN